MELHQNFLADFSRGFTTVKTNFGIIQGAFSNGNRTCMWTRFGIFTICDGMISSAFENWPKENPLRKTTRTKMTTMMPRSKFCRVKAIDWLIDWLFWLIDWLIDYFLRCFGGGERSCSLGEHLFDFFVLFYRKGKRGKKQGSSNAKKAKRGGDEDVSAALEAQCQMIWACRDLIAALPNKALKSILEANDQHVPVAGKVFRYFLIIFFSRCTFVLTFAVSISPPPHFPSISTHFLPIPPPPFPTHFLPISHPYYSNFLTCFLSFSKMLDQVTDMLVFGAPKKCTVCHSPTGHVVIRCVTTVYGKIGQKNAVSFCLRMEFVHLIKLDFCFFSADGYGCIGSVSGWAKCDFKTQTPARQAPIIPEDLLEHYHFL